MNAPADPAIFTIGHGDRTFADLERRLTAHHVQAIVDVRSVPYSRHAPDFVKAELEAITAEVGLGYRWLGDRLGGRPDDPSLLTDGAPDPTKVTGGPAFQSGIEELLALAHVSRVAVLCSELDHHHCHRNLWIAPALEAAGAHVWHIDADGSAVAHQPDLGF